MSMIRKLHADIETFGSRQLAKCGVYKYAEDPVFDLNLFGVAVNDDPVVVYDIANGHEPPEQILAAFSDNSVEKWAYNASFERVCLSVWLRRHHPEFFKGYGAPDDAVQGYLDPTGWKCSRILGAYNGLPLSLDKVGSVLGLEQQKLKEGKDLIKYFCAPCKPTKANGGRTRNLPSDAPDKWELFKKYNERDVEVEIQIQKRLEHYPVPDSVWDEYHIDQMINDRGILCDTDVVENAIKIDERTKADLMRQLQDLTGLENPNSVAQMKDWLAGEGVAVDSLGKKDVAALLEEDLPDNVRRALGLRQQLAKSSVKKYQAMQTAMCDDHRARGMFQFYGASRSGRFCLTGDHEVLTDTGWKRIDEWEGGRIAVWNAASGAVSFQDSQQVSFDYNGPMYTYTDARIDQCSTPDHKMRVKRRPDLPWEDMTVDQMASCRPTIPLNGYRYHHGCASPAWLRVLIMTQADGFYAEDGSIKYHFKKQRKIERCKMLLRKAEISFTITDTKSGTVVITVPARAVPLWLRQFRTKTFGFWLLDENPDIFFDELPNWDGYYPSPNSIQYSTCNKQNADIVQALAHMSGRTCNIRIKEHSKLHDNWHDAYVCDIWLNSPGTHEIRQKPSISHFNGRVYCAVTPTGYFLVRRNGKVWVTGNSGKLIQIQNLPQNHLPDLEEARDLVRHGNYAALKLLYDNVPQVLSELIRTAFIPKPGMKFVVSDYSSIEARVLAYLAGETHTIESFARGEDLYCATASAMFHKPVVKHGINGELRQKGKIATLACIAEGQLVSTNHGLIPIEKVTTEDLVWDGEKFVHHDGVVFRGMKDVISYGGLTATPDHVVFLSSGKCTIHFGIAAARRLELAGEGSREPTGSSDLRTHKMPVYDILNAGPNHRYTVSGCLVHNCGYGGSVGALKAMGALEQGLSEDELQPIVTAWREANPHIVKYWWDIDAAVKKAVRQHIPSEVGAVTIWYQSKMLFIKLPSGRRLSYVQPEIGTNKFGSDCITYMGIDQQHWERIESYGPKFVENIVQGVARDILCYAMKNLRDRFIVGHVHDELIVEVPMDASMQEICDIMGRTPDWMPGLLLRADGYECSFYIKS